MRAAAARRARRAPPVGKETEGRQEEEGDVVAVRGARARRRGRAPAPPGWHRWALLWQSAFSCIPPQAWDSHLPRPRFLCAVCTSGVLKNFCTVTPGPERSLATMAGWQCRRSAGSYGDGSSKVSACALFRQTFRYEPERGHAGLMVSRLPVAGLQ